MISDALSKPAPRRTTVRKAIAAASIGNALEWFDLISYAFFAPIIARLFFPAAAPQISLLIAFATFGVAFVARPLGGIILGRYADRVGRKAALLVTMSLMMAGTAIIAFTPSYASIGVIAPVLIVIARLLQGFSAGGEFSNATAFLAEQSTSRRGFYSSWQFASQGAAIFMGAAFGLILSAALTPSDLEAWGWRIPFVVGLLIGPVALFIRRDVDETDEFLRTATETSPSLTTVLVKQRYNMLIGLGAIIAGTVSTYLNIYMPAYAVTELSLDMQSGLLASAVSGAILLIVAPLAGLLVDRHGVLRIALWATGLLVVLPIPAFAWLTAAPSTERLVLVQSAISFATAAYAGALCAFLTNLFPVRSRSTGMSLSYNFSVMTFGGFAPFIMTWLIAETGWLAAPSYYLAAAAILSFIAFLASRRIEKTA